MNVKPNALKLFRSGYDYIAIAEQLGTTEAEVEKTINDERALEMMQAYRRAKNTHLREKLRAIRERASS